MNDWDRWDDEMDQPTTRSWVGAGLVTFAILLSWPIGMRILSLFS